MFDIGAIVGGLFIGFLSDITNKKAIFCSPSLLLCSITLFIISFALGDAVWPYYVTIFMAGFFLSGPYNIVGILIVFDLGMSIK